MNLTVSTHARRQVVDITDLIEDQLPKTGSGLALTTVLHTTASVTTADLDPGTDLDLLDFLEAVTPDRRWRHPHNPEHAPAHLISSIIGPSVALPYRDGRLTLGAWQRVILVELDGPKPRSISLTIIDKQ
jgi:secondary thiamine-phosphate synthase enzyme